jgi:hypothetical protein
MGASGWQYFVAYQPDIHQALQALRQAEFQRGAYHLREPYWQNMTLEGFMPPDGSLDNADRAWYAADLQRLQALPEPTTIETLRAWNAEEGTHAILDIESVATVPSLGTVSPLTTQQLESLFGTTQPTRAMVEQAQSHYATLRDRWQGLYIIVYRDGTPDEIFFTGFSAIKAYPSIQRYPTPHSV